MALKIYSQPAVEPVTIEEVKLHLRIDHSTEDLNLWGYVQAARVHVEKVLRQALITQTWDLTMDEFPAEDYIEVPLPPLASVTSITYIDEDGDSHTFSSASYFVDTQSMPGRIVLNDGYSWPADSLRAANGVTVRYVCGYGANYTYVPANFRAAVLLLTGHLYENREATSSNVYELPLGVRQLLGTDRVFTF